MLGLVSKPSDFNYYFLHYILGTMIWTLSSGIFSSQRTLLHNTARVPLQLHFAFSERFISTPTELMIPRQRMEQAFAVQLMRTSYNVTDFLDFVPMDEFQKDFFLFRQDQWEGYQKRHPGILQGDLADPAYFDFISFAQYAVINDKLTDPRQAFVEKVGASGDNQLVRRSIDFVDDSHLADYHAILVGDNLLDFLINNSTNTLSLSRKFVDTAAFMLVAQQLVDTLVSNRFATAISIQVDKANTTETQTCFSLVLQAPVNFWSLQGLLQRRCVLLNDFEVKLLQALARKGSGKLVRLNTEVVQGINVRHRLVLAI